MNAVLDLLSDLLAIDYESVADSIVMANEGTITDYNRQQLDKGLDSEGKSLGQYANVKYKGRLRPVDLDLTGAFRGSFGIDVQSGAYVSRATDYKTPFLEANYSDQIVGTPRERYDDIGELIKTGVITFIRDRI